MRMTKRIVRFAARFTNRRVAHRALERGVRAMTESVTPPNGTQPEPNPATMILPGGYIVDGRLAAAARRALPPPPAPNLADPAALGGVLVAAGVDPVSAGQVVANIQAITAQATLAAVHQAIAAVHQAQMARAEALAGAMRAMPPVDILGHRAAMAAAIADPRLPITPDPIR